MNYADANYGATLHNSQARLGGSLPPHTLFRFTGAPPVAQVCGSGQDPDGVSAESYFDGVNWVNPQSGTYALPGRPVKVYSGGAFASGANLQSNANGHVVAHASGPVVMRALQASTGSGQIVWAVFTSGR